MSSKPLEDNGTCNCQKWIVNEIRKSGNSLVVPLCYPPRSEVLPSNVTSFVIDLVDVRAANLIRISFDFERNGWIIEREDGIDEELSVEDIVEKWVEAAFIPAN